MPGNRGEMLWYNMRIHADPMRARPRAKSRDSARARDRNRDNSYTTRDCARVRDGNGAREWASDSHKARTRDSYSAREWARASDSDRTTRVTDSARARYKPRPRDSARTRYKPRTSADLWILNCDLNLKLWRL